MTCRRRTIPTIAVGALAAILVATPTRGARADSGAPPESPKVGDVFPVFDATGIDGTTRQVSYAKGSTTVLLFFLSGCPVCHRMIPEWNRAYDSRAKGLQVIGVLMDQEPPGFFTATPISFPVVRSPGIDFLRAQKVNRAPLTLRIGPGGIVKDVGVGQLDLIRLGEIFAP